MKDTAETPQPENDSDFVKREVDEYGPVRPVYGVFALILEGLLRKATVKLGVSAIIQARAKEVASFAEKCIRKRDKYPAPAKMLTDLCGARVIAEYKDQIDRICDFVRKHFEIDEANSEDTAKRLAFSEFGYQSVHFIVSLKAEEFAQEIDDMSEQLEKWLASEVDQLTDAARTKLRQAISTGEPDERDDITLDAIVNALGNKRRTQKECEQTRLTPGPVFKAEIQLRTLLQHAWATLNHDRVYKGDMEPPVELKRDLSRIAAVLEEADADLARVVQEVDSYDTYHGLYLPEPKRQEEIDKLLAVYSYDPANIHLAYRIARLCASLQNWTQVDKVLNRIVEDWRSSATGKAFLDAYDKLEAKDQKECDRARRKVRELQDPVYAALLLEYGWAGWRLGERDRRRFIEWSVHLDTESADAHLFLGRTYEQEARTADEERDAREREARARGPREAQLRREARKLEAVSEESHGDALEHYRCAYEIKPTDPEVLATYLHDRIGFEREIGFMPLVTPSLEAASTTCRQWANVGVCLPRALYDRGYFLLLLRREFESLAAFAKAALLSESERVIKKELDRVRELREAIGEKVPEIAWAERLLVLAIVAKAWARKRGARRRRQETRQEHQDAQQLAEELKQEVAKQEADGSVDEALQTRAKEAREKRDKAADAAKEAESLDDKAAEFLAEVRNVCLTDRHSSANAPGSASNLDKEAAEFIAEMRKDRPPEDVRHRAMRPPHPNRFREPLVVIAGACHGPGQQKVEQYRHHLETALQSYRGTVFSGGTDAGISGIVGSVVRDPDEMARISYLRRERSVEQVAMRRRANEPKGYDIRWLQDDYFRYTPWEPLQMWTDILAADHAPRQDDAAPEPFDPARVKLLAINGGQLAAFEIRLALAMGATVGVIRESGGAAMHVLEDVDWHEPAGRDVLEDYDPDKKGPPRLLELPDDVESVRAFLCASAGQGLTRAELEPIAKLAHDRNAEERQQKEATRGQNAPWEKLDPMFKRSVFQRWGYNAQKLRAAGLAIYRQGEEPTGGKIITEFVEGNPRHQEMIDLMAEMEHGRWNTEKLADGWRPGKKRNDEKKIHPSLVPWKDLPESEKDKDRKYAREIPVVLATFRYSVVES